MTISNNSTIIIVIKKRYAKRNPSNFTNVSYMTDAIFFIFSFCYKFSYNSNREDSTFMTIIDSQHEYREFHTFNYKQSKKQVNNIVKLKRKSLSTCLHALHQKNICILLFFSLSLEMQHTHTFHLVKNGNVITRVFS